MSLTPTRGTVQKTKVIKKTLCPTWNEEFTLCGFFLLVEQQ